MSVPTQADLDELKEAVGGLGKLQDSVFDEFCREFGIEDGEQKDYLMDFAYNDFDCNLIGENGKLLK
jgi:hypothetical protein